MAHSIRVLIVDDNEPVMALMRILLEREGAKVTGAQTGGNGLMLARSEEFDLFLLNIDLPDLNGFKVCRQLKQEPRLKDVPVVFVSGYLSPEHMGLAFELGAADYVAKPFEMSRFATRVLSHVRRKVEAQPGGKPTGVGLK